MVFGEATCAVRRIPPKKKRTYIGNAERHLAFLVLGAEVAEGLLLV
jgi:hypothetical protein